jgi:hypothetical protein
MLSLNRIEIKWQWRWSLWQYCFSVVRVRYVGFPCQLSFPCMMLMQTALPASPSPVAFRGVFCAVLRRKCPVPAIHLSPTDSWLKKSDLLTYSHRSQTYWHVERLQSQKSDLLTYRQSYSHGSQTYRLVERLIVTEVRLIDLQTDLQSRRSDLLTCKKAYSHRSQTYWLTDRVTVKEVRLTDL